MIPSTEQLAVTGRSAGDGLSPRSIRVLRKVQAGTWREQSLKHVMLLLKWLEWYLGRDPDECSKSAIASLKHFRLAKSDCWNHLFKAEITVNQSFLLKWVGRTGGYGTSRETGLCHKDGPQLSIQWTSVLSHGTALALLLCKESYGHTGHLIN